MRSRVGDAGAHGRDLHGPGGTARVGGGARPEAVVSDRRGRLRINRPSIRRRRLFGSAVLSAAGAVDGRPAAGIPETLVWVWLQLWLILRFNYSYGGSKSTDLLHGGDLVVWLGTLGPRGAAVALFGSFGALFLLMPVGFIRASRDLRLLALA